MNSQYIIILFEERESNKGSDHGDLLEVLSYGGYDYKNGASIEVGIVHTERMASWKTALPPDYQFGVPLDSEQMISIINSRAINKMLKSKIAARMKEREGDGKTWR